MFPARLGEERQTVAEPGHRAQTRDYSGSGDKRLSQTLINKTLWCVSKVNKSKKKGVSFNYSSVLAFQNTNMAKMSVLRGESKIAGTRLVGVKNMH